MKGRELLRKVVLSIGVLAGLLMPVFGVSSPVAAAGERAITLPVDPARLAEVHWTDTWGAARSGGRSHVGVDMLGPKMVPLLAARDGVISWMRHDAARGNILYLTDDEGWTYVYIHINNDTPGTDDGANRYEEAFGPGIERGARVTAGQVIAYMGDSGNAEWTASHLHFEVVDPQGNNVNPAPIVDAALASLQAPARGPDARDAGPLGSFASVNELTGGLYAALEGRAPTTSERAAFERDIAQVGTAQAIASRLDRDANVAQIERLYVTYLQRIPDTDGLRYWVDLRAQGRQVRELALYFAASDEYKARFGEQTDAQFVEQLYGEILGRPSDAEGKEYWLGTLRSGQLNRGTIGIFFSESEEQKNRSELRSEILSLSLAFQDRVPSSEELSAWTALRATTPLVDAISLQYLQ